MSEPLFDVPCFAATVIAHRQHLGLKQYEAAEQMGIHVSTLCRVEQGRLPDVENLAHVLVWLGRTFESFITCTPAHPPETSMQSKVTMLVEQDATLRQPGRDVLLSAIGVLYRHYGTRQGV